MKRNLAIVLLASTLAASSLLADEAQMRESREAVGVKAFAAAPRIVERLQSAPAMTLRPASEAIPEQLTALREWNAAGHQPARNGIVRSFGETMSVRYGGVATQSESKGRGISANSEGGTTWGTSVHVENAKRLRLHLENVKLPAGATLWVYGRGGQAIAFDAELVDPDGHLWTPSVEGDTLYLEIETAAGESVAFQAKEVLELLDARGAGASPKAEDNPSCLADQDVNCQSTSEFPAIDAVRRSVGQMEYVKDGSGYVCSGALINDQAGSNNAYFLTANHCISTQSAASSLQTYFDYVYVSCVSNSRTSLSPVNGSTLMTTSSATDVTLLRLPSLPSNRVRLGWTTTPPANGAKLHRISHPFPDDFSSELPQLYSRTIVTTTAAACSSRPRPNFVYSNESNGGEGGVYGGSSGSAAVLSDNANDARVVGQLLGSCGPDPAAGCDRRNNTVDGAFAASFAVLKPFLAPDGQSAGCTPNESTVCLMNNRFAVRLLYDIGEGAKPMTAIKYTTDTGLFWFASAANIEVLLKMVDACSFNSRFWVFVGGTTDVGVTMTVTDTQTGTVKTYTNPRGTTFRTITDTSAFATCQ